MDTKRDLGLACGVVLLIHFVLCVSSFAQATRTWTGLGADNQATSPGNWDTGLPQAGDHIVLDAGTAKNMTRNITNLVVSSWTQIGYMGTVTVATVYAPSGFTHMSITGDCIISNGVWTHTANPSVNYEVNRLCATIGGDMIVGSKP